MRRAAIPVAVALALAAVVGARLVAGTIPIAPTAAPVEFSPTPEPVPSATPTPTPTPPRSRKRTAHLVPIFLVPTRVDAVPGLQCPNGWSAFNNPVMHYAFCYPPGWGFFDFSSIRPLRRIPNYDLGGVQLKSAEAFPWKRGDSGFDAIRRRNAIDVEFMSLSPGDGLSQSCYPHRVFLLDGLSARSCVNVFDLGGPGHPSDEITMTRYGAFTGVLALVPFRHTPPQSFGRDGKTYGSSDRSRDRLFIDVLLRSDRYRRESSLVWRLIRTIHVY